MVFLCKQMSLELDHHFAFSPIATGFGHLLRGRRNRKFFRLSGHNLFLIELVLFLRQADAG